MRRVYNLNVANNFTKTFARGFSSGIPIDFCFAILRKGLSTLANAGKENNIISEQLAKRFNECYCKAL
jgi:hypothetical protein